MAVGRLDVLATIEGEVAREPVYGLPGKWIPVETREAVQARGALVFDPISIVGSHLSEIARQRAWQIFGRQELHTLVEHLKRSVPVVMKDVGTDVLPIGALHKAMTTLLRERFGRATRSRRSRRCSRPPPRVAIRAISPTPLAKCSWARCCAGAT